MGRLPRPCRVGTGLPLSVSGEDKSTLNKRKTNEAECDLLPSKHSSTSTFDGRNNPMPHRDQQSASHLPPRALLERVGGPPNARRCGSPGTSFGSLATSACREQCSATCSACLPGRNCVDGAAWSGSPPRCSPANPGTSGCTRAVRGSCGSANTSWARCCWHIRCSPHSGSW